MAGENLDLKIIIDTLLNAKGFQEAQAGLAGLAKTTNESAKVTEGASGKQKGLAKELGGSRGAVADLTRVMLMNIGVTGAAGNVAKAAGIAMNTMGGAASFASFGAAGLVAAVALLLPKLLDWFNGTKDVKEETDLLTGSVSSEIDFLEEYITKVGSLSGALLVRLARLKEVAFEEQKLKIQTNLAEIEKLEGLTKKLNEANAKRFRVTENYVEEDKKATEEAKNLSIQVEAAGTKIAALKAENVELNDAIRQGIVLERERRIEIKLAGQAQDEMKKALEERRKEEERLKKLREDDAKLAFQLKTEKAKEENAARAQHQKDIDRAAQAILIEERRKKGQLEEIEEAKKASKEKRALEAQQFASSVGFYLSFFKQNKAVRIAQAIADTYAAATRALAEGGPYLGPVLAAAMVAAGLKNIAEIRKTEVGFDNPLNDMLAQRLGRKFATDVLSHINAGFGSGLRELSGGGSVVHQTTINRGTTNNITANGVIGTRTGFRSWLEREMTLAERVRRRKTI